MSDPTSDKDFPIFGSTRSQKSKEKDKKKATHPAPLTEANTTDTQSDMALVLSEVKANGSRLEGITNRLEGIAGSVSSLQNSFAALTERIESIETRLTEAEGRISSAEDSAVVSEGQLANILTQVEQLQSKVDDLENRGRRKNLRIVGLPERVEGSGPLRSFSVPTFPNGLTCPQTLSPWISKGPTDLLLLRLSIRIHPRGVFWFAFCGLQKKKLF